MNTLIYDWHSKNCKGLNDFEYFTNFQLLIYKDFDFHLLNICNCNRQQLESDHHFTQRIVSSVIPNCKITEEWELYRMPSIVKIVKNNNLFRKNIIVVNAISSTNFKSYALTTKISFVHKYSKDIKGNYLQAKKELQEIDANEKLLYCLDQLYAFNKMPDDEVILAKGIYELRKVLNKSIKNKLKQENHA